VSAAVCRDVVVSCVPCMCQKTNSKQSG
jgi:hypothetical protein